jgi:hypothetical protein
MLEFATTKGQDIIDMTDLTEGSTGALKHQATTEKRL